MLLLYSVNSDFKTIIRVRSYQLFIKNINVIYLIISLYILINKNRVLSLNLSSFF